MAEFSVQYMEQVAKIAQQLSISQVDGLIDNLSELRVRGGRLFFLGVGGSAANCSHAVNDFRKLAAIEAYAPTDNVSELTARTNDEGWDSVFAEWLRISKLNENDAVFVFSVGGGDLDKNISVNIVMALKYALSCNSTILGIVGRENGYANQVADCCVVVPCVDKNLITPHSEAFQSIIWHLVVSHPKLKVNETKW